MRGTQSQKACRKCTRGQGPLGLYVILDKFSKGAYSNCHYLGQGASCTFCAHEKGNDLEPQSSHNARGTRNERYEPKMKSTYSRMEIALQRLNRGKILWTAIYADEEMKGQKFVMGLAHLLERTALVSDLNVPDNGHVNSEFADT